MHLNYVNNIDTKTNQLIVSKTKKQKLFLPQYFVTQF